MMKVCAVVVTYNRKVMLEQCINALLGQSYSKYDIIIVDNASTDGTQEFVEKKFGQSVIYINTGANLGGSGGFYYGMRYAYEHNYDLLWVMDDDVVPTRTALSELINHSKYVKSFSFLASAVYAADNTALNSPEISGYKTNGYKFWYEKLEYGMVRLSHATFVSLLIKADAIRQCGLPCKDFFIWGDDIEYTKRIVGNYAPAFIVGTSKVYHMRQNVSNLNICTEKNPNRIKMLYYLIRNTIVYTDAYSGKKAAKNKIKQYRKDCIKIALSNVNYKNLRISTILRAIRGFKKGEFNLTAFKNRFQVYGQEKAVINFIGLPEISSYAPEWGYMYNCKLDEFNIFTLYENVPAYIKEISSKWNLSSSTRNDIIQYGLKFRGGSNRNEYLVADISGSLKDYVIFSNNDDTFALSYTDSLKQELSDGSLKYLVDNYDLQITNSCNLKKGQLEQALTTFAVDISGKCRIDHIIFIKKNVPGADENLTQLYDSMFKIVTHLMPESNILDLTDISQDGIVYDLAKDRLYKLIDEISSNKV